MAASPGGPINNTPPALNSNLFSQNLGTSPKMGVCRLCAKEDLNCIEIYSDAGKSKELPEKVKLCLPVLISENDDLSKAVCPSCIDGIETVRAFFQQCFNANQELIISYRKSKPCPLDLPTHINQYVRSFNPPSVPHIKIEPSSYLDVDLGPLEEKLTNGYYDDEWIVDASDGESESEDCTDSEEDLISNDDLFKIPKIPNGKKKSNRKSKKNKLLADLDPNYIDDKKSVKNGLNSSSSGRGRKRFVPIALKTCSICGQEFADHAGNLAHWKEIHPDQEVIYKCLEIERTTQQLCNFTSKESEEIFKHRSKHKIIRENSQTAVDVKPDVTIDCKICGKIFPTSFLIYRHMSSHEGHKDFKCGVCGIVNKSSEDLKIHLKTHDPDDVKYSHCCELCGKRFTQRANLDAHLRVHSGYKPYNCDFCGKSFSQKGNMEEHRRVHTGERPFVCEQCGASFVRRSEMALHNRIVHTGERPYQCAYCPKNFQRRDLMRKHERIHTDTRPYACQFCHKAFTQRDKMVVHTRLHTGERPYVCEQCGKGFCESGNLKKHMRVHGKEPPHIMHQNNKGKPAPNQAGGVANANFDMKPTPNQLLLQQQQFQQQMANEADTNSNNSSASSSTHITTTTQPQQQQQPGQQQQHQQSQQRPAVAVPLSGAGGTTSSSGTGGADSVVVSCSNSPAPNPSPASSASAANNLPLHLKLQDQHTQYPFAAVAAALHNQIPSHNSTRYQDQDAQSDTGSERSVTPAAFVATTQPHPAHHQTPQGIPYHMHHSLIQHLTDMRDLYGSHQSITGISNHHNSN